MKNNEIIVSARFLDEEISEELSVLVLKDISLKSLIEAFYYGLKKSKDHEKAAELLERYLKTRKQLQVLYTAMGDHSVIDFTEKDEDGTPVFEKSLDKLGFVTSSCLLFTMDTQVNQVALFERVKSSYILSRGDSLEYNISTRRLNVIEPSVVDILPAGELPEQKKSSLQITRLRFRVQIM